MANDEISFSAYLFNKTKNFLQQFDFLQITILFALLFIGVLSIYGTGQQIGDPLYESAYKKQITWIILGSISWLTLSLIDYRKLILGIWPLYGISLLLLTLVLFYGKIIFGAQRWLSIGGINIQPSEVAKFATLLTLAWLFSRRGFSINKLPSLIITTAIGGLQFLLILIEPDLGSSLVVVAITIALVFAAGLRWKIILMPLAFAMLYIAYVETAWHFSDHPPVTEKNRLELNVKAYAPFLHEYQQERILVFLDPTRDMRNKGWNQLQAGLAVGSGGMWGKGFMQGTQNQLGFLPQTVSNSDFIFPVIAEEWGFVGSSVIVTLYILLICSILRTALLARDLFGRYIAVGTAAVFFTHSVVNIGMSIRLMPVTGLPLPFLSYGGTFVVISMSYLGLLQSIYKQRRTPSKRPGMEATRITNTMFG